MSALFTNFENMPSPTKSKVCFFYETSVTLKNREALKRYVETIFKKEKRTLDSLNYIFCSDKKVLEINNQYLKHDYYTDIITFELSGKEEPVNGEVYISVDRVKDNAEHLEQTFQRELHRVIFHGALHLCGYGDKSKAEKQKMRDREEFYLQNYID